MSYLLRHKDCGLTYEAEPTDLRGFSDSDWAVQHSTSGWLIQWKKACISWGSQKQRTIALSSCEAEIVALSEAAKDTLYFRKVLEELGTPSKSATALATDNKAARDLAYNPEHHKRTKHVERRHFFIRECVEDMKIAVPLVKTTDNLADFFTKPLPAKTFFTMRNEIMNIKGDHTTAQPKAS